MRWTGRLGAGALAALAAGFLVHVLLGAGRPGTVLPFVLLAAASLVWFARASHLAHLAIVVPLGPLLDFPLLAVGREVYATEVVLLSALVGWGMRGAMGGIRPETGPLRKAPPVALLVACAAVGAAALCLGQAERAWSPEGMRALRVLVLAAGTGVIVLSLVRDGARGERAVRHWLLATLACLAAVSLGGLVEFALALGRYGRIEPGSVYRSSIALATHVAFFSPLALAVWLCPAGRRTRLAAGAAWLLALLCLPLTASRGALASVAIVSAGLVIVAARGGGRARLRSAWIALAVLVAVLVVLAVRPEIAGESFAYKFRATVAGDFFSTRIEAWRASLAAVRAHPLAGEDPAAWAPAVWLELARRYGVPAALLMLAATTWAAVAAARAWRGGPTARRDVSGGDDGAPADPLLRAAGPGLAAGLAAFLLVGIAETALGARMTPLLAAAAGVAAGISEHREETRS